MVFVDGPPPVKSVNIFMTKMPFMIKLPEIRYLSSAMVQNYVVKQFLSSVSFILSHFLLLICILESDGIVSVLSVLVCNRKTQNQEPVRFGEQT